MSNPDYASAADPAEWAADVDSLSGLGAPGTLAEPLLWLPLHSNLDMLRGNGNITFARAVASASPSLTSYVDRYGVIQYASVDEARFEKNGLLMEGSSQNIIKWSEDFTNPVWADSGTPIITGNDAVAPDGNTTADKIEDNNGAAYEGLLDTLSLTPAGAAVTLSIFVKQDTIDGVRLRSRLRGGTDMDGSARFTFSTGLITVDGDADSATATELADGWWRITLTIIDNNSGNTLSDLFILGGIDAPTTGTFWVWGAQMEEMPFATSYIPTTTAVVTRADDDCSVDIAGNIGLQADSGTVLCDISLLGLATSNQIALIINGETQRRMIIHNASDSLTRMLWGDVIAAISTPSPNQIDRYGMRYNGDKLSSWKNGILSVQVTPTDVSDLIGTLIDFGATAQKLFGHISNVRIYNRALTDQEMAVA